MDEYRRMGGEDELGRRKPRYAPYEEEDFEEGDFEREAREEAEEASAAARPDGRPDLY